MERGAATPHTNENVTRQFNRTLQILPISNSQHCCVLDTKYSYLACNCLYKSYGNSHHVDRLQCTCSHQRPNMLKVIMMSSSRHIYNSLVSQL